MTRFGTVIFDCDSTLSAVEGIAEIAGEHRAEIERLTDAAMAGRRPLESVYGPRLELARPDRSALEALGGRYIERSTPDAGEVVAALRRAGIAVRILSGGFAPAVRILGRALGLADEATDAVDIHFDSSGRYAGFDESSPLAREGGKAQAIRQRLPRLARPIMLVGDGATDLEARAVVDLFVAYAGVVERPSVTAAAEVVVRSASLAPILCLALDDASPADRDRALFDRGRALMKTEVVDRRSVARADETPNAAGDARVESP